MGNISCFAFGIDPKGSAFGLPPFSLAIFMENPSRVYVTNAVSFRRVFISPITKASSFVSYDTSHYLYKSKWPLSLLAHCAIVCLHERIQTPLFNSSAVTVIVECNWTALGEFTNCGKILRNILDSKMED